MSRISRAVVALLTLVGFVVAAAPLRADEGHCARPEVAVSAHAHGPAQVTPAPSPGTVSTEHGCPACPARSCGAMHGCSAAPQVTPEIIVVRTALPPAHRAVLLDTEAVPASVTHTPPTPPPLVVLSLA